MARSSSTIQRYPESLRNIALVLRTIGVGLDIGLLVVAIMLTQRTGDTPPITYVAVIWSLLLNLFDWCCLLARARIEPGPRLSLDLIAAGLLIAGTVNLAIVDYGGDGEGKQQGEGSLKAAERWLQGVLIAVHVILLGYGCLDCNIYLNGRKYSSESSGSSSRRSRRGSHRSTHGYGYGGGTTYRETETVRVSVRK